MNVTYVTEAKTEAKGDLKMTEEEIIKGVEWACSQVAGYAQMTKEKKIVLQTAIRCRDDIGFFARMFFPHIMNKAPAKFHQEVFSDLKDAHYYACAAPRGHAKSTLGLIIYPIHFALFKSTGDITLLLSLIHI